MTRTTCPKCGREDAVADYLVSLPIMCNGCGTRVTIGEPIDTRPVFPPPIPPTPPVPPLPKAAIPAPSPPKVVAPPPPKPKSKPVPPPPAVVPLVPVNPVESPVELTDVSEPPIALTAPPVVKPAAVPPPEEPPFPLPLAGVGRRLLARFLFLLGLAMMGGLGFGVLVLGGPALKRDLVKDPMLASAVLAAFPVIYLLVNAAMLARTGQDVGKRYAGIRIVNADGSNANEKTALLKRDALTFLIGLTGVGVLYWLADLVTLFGKGGRCLHDRIAGTRVVRA